MGGGATRWPCPPLTHGDLTGLHCGITGICATWCMCGGHFGCLCVRRSGVRAGRPFWQLLHMHGGPFGCPCMHPVESDITHWKSARSCCTPRGAFIVGLSVSLWTAGEHAHMVDEMFFPFPSAVERFIFWAYVGVLFGVSFLFSHTRSTHLYSISLPMLLGNTVAMVTVGNLHLVGLQKTNTGIYVLSPSLVATLFASL